MKSLTRLFASAVLLAALAVPACALERRSITVTTDGSGVAAVKSPNITGMIHSITYIKGNFADGVDFTITLEKTGQNAWTQTDRNSSQTVYPRVPSSTPAGANSAITEVPIYIVNDRINFAIAQGGAGTSGVFEVVLN